MRGWAKSILLGKEKQKNRGQGIDKGMRICCYEGILEGCSGVMKVRKY